MPINIDRKIEDVMGLSKVSSINDLFSFLQPTKNAELRISNKMSLFESSKILMDDKYSLHLPHHSQIALADADEDSEKKHEPLTVAYLQQEIGLSESVLMNVIIKYSWVMYLKVSTNLRPTVDVLRSFGFREKDIRSIVGQTPSILAINHEWTLPEKLISLQKMFNLNRIALVKVVVSQPYLLTSSIERNLAISDFLSEVAGLSPEEVRSLLVCEPRIAMTGAAVLAGCWSLFTELYGLSDGEAKQACIRHPVLLSRLVLKDLTERLRFFSEDLCLPPPPFEELQKMLMRFPPIMYLDTNVFLRPNLLVLQHWLCTEQDSGDRKEREAILKMLSAFPQLLGYNPTYLQVLCQRALRFLTSDERYAGCAEDQDSKVSAHFIDHYQSQAEADLIVDIVQQQSTYQNEESSSRHDLEAMDASVQDRAAKVYVERGRSLRLGREKAMHILRSTPWILSYRTERSQVVLAALAVSLGMTTAELTRCVSTYPRLLSLSVEGKLHTLLRTLARAAAFHLHHEGRYHHTQKLKDNGWKSTAMPSCEGDEDTVAVLATEQPEESMCDSQAVDSVAEAVRSRRGDKVRAMVRELVIKYPLILGTSMNRISERLEAMQAAHYHSVWHQNDDYCGDLKKEDKKEGSYQYDVSTPSGSSPLQPHSQSQWGGDFLTILRRSPEAHRKWQQVQSQSLLSPSLQLSNQVES
eukprot:gene23285-31613_t